MGDTTLGRYELITKIGQGGMAEVHLALHRGPAGFEKLVVVKVIHEALASDKAVADSLLDEARLAAQIKHPNVVDVYELGEEAGRYFIAMEYLEGETLLAVLEAGVVGPRLDPLAMARIVADTAEGLDAAHKLKNREGQLLDLVHDDISLGNIVVLYTGQVKLVDFGVAKAKHTAETTDKIYGKPAYIAPEKLDGRSADKRTDIWSLGVVMWEALAQKRLFRGDNPTQTIREVRYVKITPPSQANPSVPPELDAIVLRMLDRDWSKRYATAKEVAIAIEEVLRAKGYDAKNDRIADYMQKTFAEHIRARNHLVAEVTRRSRPSNAMLEAAFGTKVGPVPVFDPDPPPDLMAPDPEPLVNPYALPAPPSAAVVVPNPFEDGDVGETVADLVPPDPAASRATRPRPDPTWSVSKHGSSIGQLQSWVQREREAPDKKPPVVAYLVGSAVVLLIIVGIVLATRDDKSRRVATAPRDAAVAVVRADAAEVEPPPVAIDAAEVAVATPPDAEEAPIDAPPDAPDEIVMEPPPDAASDPGSGSSTTHRPKPTKSAEQLYNEGMQWLRKGEPRKALASLSDSRRVNERFAPTWYGLGVVHEQLGNRPSAKTAYQRYLKLAPKAANAQIVRERLARL